MSFWEDWILGGVCSVGRMETSFPVLSEAMCSGPLICLSGTTAARGPLYILSTVHSRCLGMGTGIRHNIRCLSRRTASLRRTTHRAIHGFVGTPGIRRIVFAHNAARDLGLIISSFYSTFVDRNSRIVVSAVRRRSGVIP